MDISYSKPFSFFLSIRWSLPWHSNATSDRNALYPVLTYGIEITQVKNRDDSKQQQAATKRWLYPCLRRIKMDFRCLSLQGLLGRPTWEQLVEKTRPSRPIRCDVWIERMRYPTNIRTVSQRGASSHLKTGIIECFWDACCALHRGTNNDVGHARE